MMDPVLIVSFLRNSYLKDKLLAFNIVIPDSNNPNVLRAWMALVGISVNSHPLGMGTPAHLEIKLGRLTLAYVGA